MSKVKNPLSAEQWARIKALQPSSKVVHVSKPVQYIPIPRMDDEGNPLSIPPGCIASEVEGELEYFMPYVAGRGTGKTYSPWKASGITKEAFRAARKQMRKNGWSSTDGVSDALSGATLGSSEDTDREGGDTHVA